jgi:hypothetical protein
LTIFIAVPFQSRPIEPDRRVVKDRGLFAFIEVSDGIPACPVYQRLRTFIMDFQSDPANNTPLCLNPAPTSKMTTHLMTADSTPRLERPAEAGAVFDAVVVGAGFAGMYMLHRLRGAFRRGCLRPAAALVAMGKSIIIAGA